MAGDILLNSICTAMNCLMRPPQVDRHSVILLNDGRQWDEWDSWNECDIDKMINGASGFQKPEGLECE